MHEELHLRQCAEDVHLTSSSLSCLTPSSPLQAVIRGPHELPGAVAVEDERGRVVQLDRLDKPKREGLAKALLSTTASGRGSTLVVTSVQLCQQASNPVICRCQSLRLYGQAG
jgi:hypothetical protein